MVLDELVTLLGLQVDGAAFARGEAALKSLKTGVLAIGAVAAAGAAALGAMVESTVQAGIEAARGAQMVGMTTEAFQELSYAAEASGLSTESFQQGMGFLARNMAAAARGSKEAEEAFSAVGVSITDVNGKLRPTEDMLEDLSDHFSTMPDSTEKTAQAMQIFGRAGKQLIPFLNKGRDGIADLRNEAEKLGVVLDSEAIEKTKRFHEAQVRMNAALTGLRNAIAVPLLDAIRPLIESFTEWARVNRTIIAQRVHQVVGAIASALKILAVIFGKLMTVVRAFTSNATAMKVTLIALGVILAVLAGEFIAAGVAAVGAAIASAAAWLIATAPIALLVALLGLVVLVAEDIYQALTGGKSLIADLIAKYGELVDRWLYNTEGDGWFMKALKVVLWTVTHLGEVWDEFVSEVKSDLAWIWDKAKAIGRFVEGAAKLVGGSVGFAPGAETATPEQAAANLDRLTDAELRSQLQQATAEHNIGHINAIFAAMARHAAAATSAAAGTAPAGPSFGEAIGSTPFAPNFYTTIVQQPGESPDAVASRTVGAQRAELHLMHRRAKNGT
jgi:hypothetical protein